MKSWATHVARQMCHRVEISVEHIFIGGAARGHPLRLASRLEPGLVGTGGSDNVTAFSDLSEQWRCDRMIDTC